MSSKHEKNTNVPGPGLEVRVGGQKNAFIRAILYACAKRVEKPHRMAVWRIAHVAYMRRMAYGNSCNIDPTIARSHTDINLYRTRQITPVWRIEIATSQTPFAIRAIRHAIRHAIRSHSALVDDKYCIFVVIVTIIATTTSPYVALNSVTCGSYFIFTTPSPFGSFPLLVDLAQACK